MMNRLLAALLLSPAAAAAECSTGNGTCSTAAAEPGPMLLQTSGSLGRTASELQEQSAGCDGVYEAELANLRGVKVIVKAGISGTGYADFQSRSNDYIEWTLPACEAGPHLLAFTYALGRGSRPLRLVVNGATEVSSLAFASTGSWRVWEDVEVQVNLATGSNTVKLLAIGRSGGNFDKLTVSRVAPQPPTQPPTTQPPTTQPPTTRPPMPPDAIKSSVTKNSVRVDSCSESAASLDAKGVAKVTHGSTSLYAGYLQPSTTNQDPVLLRFDGGVLTYCNKDIETTGDDGMAQGLLWDTREDFFYLACTSKGTQNNGVKYQTWTSGGWIPNFFGTIAQSNNVKVSVLLRIDLATGGPTAGTFAGAKLSNGNANTMVVREMGFSGGDPVFMFDSWYAPVDDPATKTRMQCTGSSPLPFNLRLSRDLSSMVEGCGNALPSSSSSCVPTKDTCPNGSIQLD